MTALRESPLNKLFSLVFFMATLFTLTACDYIKLFRPRVLKQLNVTSWHFQKSGKLVSSTYSCQSDGKVG